MGDNDSAFDSGLVIPYDWSAAMITADAQQTDPLPAGLDVHQGESKAANIQHGQSASTVSQTLKEYSVLTEVVAKPSNSSLLEHSNGNKTCRKRGRIELMARMKQLQTLLEKVERVKNGPENTQGSIELFYRALNKVKLYLWPSHNDTETLCSENKPDVFKFRLRLTLCENEENPGCYVTTGHSTKSPTEAKNNAILAAIDNMLQPGVYHGLSSDNNGAKSESSRVENSDDIEEIVIEESDVTRREGCEKEKRENNKSVLEMSPSKESITMEPSNEPLRTKGERETGALKRDKFRELVDDKSDIQVVNSLRNMIKSNSVNKVANGNHSPIVLGKIFVYRNP